jgi:23S rRNA (uracil1939-C5)-methyltransferase
MALAGDAQRAAKQAWVARALRGLAVEIRPILAPAALLGYRGRARMVVRDGRLSFAAAGSHRGAAPTACPVLVPRLQRVLLECSAALVPQLGEGGSLAGLAGWHQGMEAVHLALEPAGYEASRLAALRRGIEVLLSRGDIVGASLRETPGEDAALSTLGTAQISLVPPEEAASLGELWGSAAGFAQACLAGHTLLPRLVAEAVQAPRQDGQAPSLAHVLELYSGSGNLSRALRPLTPALTCVEGDPAAVARARQALGTDLTLQAEPVTTALARLRLAGPRPSVVVLDPPRAGAAEVMPQLAALAPQRVVYVSCDVMTLARDLKLLADRGYSPRWVQPIDLMPHTAEIECLAVCDAAAATPT